MIEIATRLLNESYILLRRYQAEVIWQLVDMIGPSFLDSNFCLMV